MGRKIPGRKHRGTKDPDKQRRQRFNSIKNKINLAPSNPDVQETPHSINKIATIKERLKHKQQRTEGPKPKKKSEFQKKKGESNSRFLYRVSKACDAAIQENAFENKYGVKIKRNPTTGKVEGVEKKPINEIDKLMSKMRKKKNLKGKKKLKQDEPRLTKSQKRRKKILEKTEKKKLINTEFEIKTDSVKFGEVVHAPPVLSTPRYATKVTTVARPGQKELLLSSLVQKTQAIPPTKNKINKVANKPIDKTGKRKDLPNALRRKLDQQQTEIIKAYRLLKKQKNLGTSE